MNSDDVKKTSDILDKIIDFDEGYEKKLDIDVRIVYYFQIIRQI